MTVWLLIYIIIGGVDYGGPPLQMHSMEQCEERAAALRATEPPNGAIVRVGCMTEQIAGQNNAPDRL